MKLILATFLVVCGLVLLIADAGLEAVCLVGGAAIGILLGMVPEVVPVPEPEKRVRVRVEQVNEEEELTAIDAMPWGSLPHKPPAMPMPSAAQRKRFEATIVPKGVKI